MCQIGPCPILRVEFDYRAPTDEAASSLFGSLLRPYWRESEAQLTEKQAVLLMHNIYLLIVQNDKRFLLCSCTCRMVQTRMMVLRSRDLGPSG